MPLPISPLRLLCAALLFAAACSDGSIEFANGLGDGADLASPDTGDVATAAADEGPRDVAGDPGPRPDRGAPPSDFGAPEVIMGDLTDAARDGAVVDIDAADGGAPCEGCFGSPCAENADCLSGWCTETFDGQTCTETCVDRCPAGFSCRQLTDDGGDPVFLCLFEHLPYCRPCDDDGDCAHPFAVGAGGRCVAADGGAGSFCATPCDAGQTCPDGAACQDVALPAGLARLCRPVEGECPCSARATEEGASTTCRVVNEFGACAGTRRCEAAGLSACDGPAAQAEACNDLDDDCDGATDEDFAEKGSSCDGDDEDQCADGVWACDGSALVCDDDADSRPEICNDLDDDCDGETDESHPDKGQPCDGNDVDLCADGIWRCDGGGLSCDDDESSHTELCNDLDDDCDGETDEDFADKGAACDGDDADQCADGVRRCLPDGTLGCDDDLAAAEEVCNGLDDDCDGETDEGVAGAGEACSEGPCRVGVTICDGQAVVCAAEVIADCCGNEIVEGDETCDGDCPTSCDDGIGCTIDASEGAAVTCDLRCVHARGTDDGTDSDGDRITDCDEATDAHPYTDPARFNGMHAIVGAPPTDNGASSQCDLYFGDNFGQMEQLFANSNQFADLRAGWSYDVGANLFGGRPYAELVYGFEPNWGHSDRMGAFSSFQLRFSANIWLAEGGTHCFSVDTGSGGFGPGDIAGRRNACGRVYVDPGPSTLPIAETGYGSAASPSVGCINLPAGEHRIVLASRHYETYFYGPTFRVRHCFGGATECVPEALLDRTVMQARP